MVNIQIQIDQFMNSDIGIILKIIGIFTVIGIIIITITNGVVTYNLAYMLAMVVFFGGGVLVAVMTLLGNAKKSFKKTEL